MEVHDATVRASNLPRVFGAAVKCQKLNGDMASAFDCFAELSTRIEKMKMETTISLQERTRSLN